MIRTRSINHPASLLAVVYITAAGALLFNAQPAVVGVLAEVYGFSDVELGRVMSAALVAAFCVIVSAFFWVPRISWPLAVVASAVVALVGSTSLLLVEGHGGVVLCFTLIGAGMAGMYSPAISALGAAADPARAFGLAISAQVVVASLTVYLLPNLLPSFGLSGVVGYLIVVMLLALAAVRLIPARHGAVTPTGATRAGDGSGARYALLGLLAMLIYFAGLNGTWVFLERIGVRAGLATDAVGAFLATSLLVGALGAMAASLLGRRVSVPRALVAAAAGFLLFLLLITSAPSALRFALSLVIFNVAWNFSLPYQVDVITRVDPGLRYIVLVPAAQTIGGAVGPAVSGALLASVGLAAVYTQLIVCVLAAFCLYSVLSARTRFVVGTAAQRHA